MNKFRGLLLLSFQVTFFTKLTGWMRIGIVDSQQRCIYERLQRDERG